MGRWGKGGKRGVNVELGIIGSRECKERPTIEVGGGGGALLTTRPPPPYLCEALALA